MALSLPLKERWLVLLEELGNIRKLLGGNDDWVRAVAAEESAVIIHGGGSTNTLGGVSRVRCRPQCVYKGAANFYGLCSVVEKVLTVGVAAHAEVRLQGGVGPEARVCQ